MSFSCSARITRTAISPRFATRTRLNIRRASSGGGPTGSSSNSSWPNSTGSALPTWIVRTIPAASALISFISFIASRMQSVWPGATVSPSWTNGGAPGCGAR